MCSYLSILLRSPTFTNSLTTWRHHSLATYGPSTWTPKPTPGVGAQHTLADRVASSLFVLVSSIKIKIHSIIYFPPVLFPTFLFRSASRWPYYHTGPGSFGSRFRVFRQHIGSRNSKNKANKLIRKSCFLEVGCCLAGGVEEGFSTKNLFPPTDPLVNHHPWKCGGVGGFVLCRFGTCPPPLILAPLEVGSYTSRSPLPWPKGWGCHPGAGYARCPRAALLITAYSRGPPGVLMNLSGRSMACAGV